MTQTEGEPENTDGEKKEQRVAKTLMEIDIESVSKLAEAAAKQQADAAAGAENQTEKSKKTGESKNQTDKGKKKDRVAKTMLEVDISSLDKLGEALIRDDDSAAAESIKESAAAAEAAIQAAIREAESEAAQEPENKDAIAARPTPRRKLKRLSRTLIEFPLDDLEANRLTEDYSEPAPSASTAPDAAPTAHSHQTSATVDSSFVSPIIGGSLTGSMPKLPEDNLDQTRPAGQGDAYASSAASSSTATPVPAPSLSGDKPKGGTRSIRRARKTDFVCKTMLDHSVLFDTVAKSKAKMDAKAMEKIKERLLEPAKPFVPIVCDRKATVCAFKWDDPEPRERFKICSLCQTPVYNLSDLELPEAEAIIFQRENIKKPVLYKRADGKYMTRDCPREAMRRQQQMMMILVGATVAVALLTMMIMFPPPKPEAKAPPPEVTTDKPTVVKRRRKPSSVTNKDGSLHYEAGKPVQENPDTSGSGTASSGGDAGSGASGTSQPGQGGAFATFPEPSKTPDNNQGASSSEESGSFWQYSDGQGK